MAVNSFNAQNPPVNTKGDVFTFSTVPARLAVGANDTVLTADSSTATGLKWAAPAAGANWTLFNAGGTALTGAATITVSSITAADKLMILVEAGSSANSGSTITLRLNGDTGSNYYNFGTQLEIGATYNTDIASIVGSTGAATNALRFATMGSNAASQFAGYVSLTGCNSSGVKMFNTVGASNNGGGSSFVHRIIGGYYNSASAITSVSIISSSGNFDAGTLYIYRSN